MTGCAQFQELSLNRASVSDFSVLPRIGIQGRIMTLELGEPVRKPLRACRPMVHRRGLVLLMEARYTREPDLPRLWTFDLSRLAFDEHEIPRMEVFWIEPDGSHKLMKTELETIEREGAES